MRVGTLLAAVAALWFQPAAAETYLIAYKGVLGGAHDETGVFGTPGANLTGLPFLAVYTLTAPLAGAVTGDDGTRAFITGGEAYSAPSPLSLQLTINGVTEKIFGITDGRAERVNGFGGQPDGIDGIFNQLSVNRDDIGAGLTRFDVVEHFIYSAANDFLSTRDYTAPLSYKVQAGDEAQTSFWLEAWTIGNSSDSKRLAYGDFITRSVSMHAVVPEPSTWALMILGIGAIGGVMRKRSLRPLRTSFL